MGFVVGTVLGLAVGGFATRVGLDRERAFYATVTIIVASYYVLFAAISGSPPTLLTECTVMIPFVVVAVAGFKREPWLFVVALATHGALDLVHPVLVVNTGVPSWWPDFCCAYDVAAAGYLAARLSRSQHGAVSGAFWTAIAHAHAAMRAADHDTAMRQLERAHILGQRQLGPHLYVHWLMLRVELRRRSGSAALGQVARLGLGIVGNLVGVLPTGNRGSSHVSMFRQEPIPAELAVLLNDGDVGRGGFHVAAKQSQMESRS